MRVHYLQHVPFEGLGSMTAWLESRRFPLTATRFYADGRLPSLDEIDWLIVLGGPMSANDEVRFPWLRGEKAFIAKALELGKTVVGICLGAQLIASALGARVYANPEPEIGWFPVEKVVKDDAAGLAGVLPARADVFHWHGETFDLPGGARLIARSEACENQAFSISRKAIGLQFHLETTREAAAGMIRECGGDLAPGRFVQTAGEILSSAETFQRINALMDRLLESLERGAAPSTE
jgi:GMP synthase-like glutamine amidotransferase